MEWKMKNDDPGPSFRIAHNRPRKRSTIDLQTDNPMPMPLLFVDYKASKSISAA
jgi:hypothetical protein